jgi:hypothetical protein
MDQGWFKALMKVSLSFHCYHCWLWCSCL